MFLAVPGCFLAPLGDWVGAEGLAPLLRQDKTTVFAAWRLCGGHVVPGLVVRSCTIQAIILS